MGVGKKTWGWLSKSKKKKKNYNITQIYVKKIIQIHSEMWQAFNNYCTTLF